MSFPPNSTNSLEFRIETDFSTLTRWPPWAYPNFTHVYCTDEYRITGERNYLVGSLYITQYLLYVMVYVPTLIVIARPPLIRHACYKLMLIVGVLDNMFGFYTTFVAGIYQLIGGCDISNSCFHPLLACFRSELL